MRGMGVADMTRVWNLVGFARQDLSLAHAEPVLFIGDGQGQPAKLHLLLQQGVGAHHQGQGAGGQGIAKGLALLFQG